MGTLHTLILQLSVLCNCKRTAVKVWDPRLDDTQKDGGYIYICPGRVGTLSRHCQFCVSGAVATNAIEALQLHGSQPENTDPRQQHSDDDIRGPVTPSSHRRYDEPITPPRTTQKCSKASHPSNGYSRKRSRSLQFQGDQVFVSTELPCDEVPDSLKTEGLETMKWQFSKGVLCKCEKTAVNIWHPGLEKAQNEDDRYFYICKGRVGTLSSTSCNFCVSGAVANKAIQRLWELGSQPEGTVLLPISEESHKRGGTMCPKRHRRGPI